MHTRRRSSDTVVTLEIVAAVSTEESIGTLWRVCSSLALRQSLHLLEVTGERAAWFPGPEVSVVNMKGTPSQHSRGHL